jgi:putative ABC transport system ATP-binding protein
MGNGTASSVESSLLIRAQNLTKNYQVGEVTVRALRGVTFDVREGEFIVVLGPSGSGKSTLLNMLGGMETPTSGKFWFEDREVSAYSSGMLTEYRKKEIGFVFQFYNLVPNLTARENVELSAEISNNPMDVEELLDAVDLGDRADHFPSQMSGGEQQRVAIARALAKNPSLVLCDEPTGALDYETGKLILELLERVNQQMKKTLMVITHNAPIGGMADRIFRLRSGRISDMVENETRKTTSEIEW